MESDISHTGKYNFTICFACLLCEEVVEVTEQLCKLPFIRLCALVRCWLSKIHLKGVAAVEVGADDPLESRRKVALIIYTVSPSIMLLKVDEHLVKRVLVNMMQTPTCWFPKVSKDPDMSDTPPRYGFPYIQISRRNSNVNDDDVEFCPNHFT